LPFPIVQAIVNLVASTFENANECDCVEGGLKPPPWALSWKASVNHKNNKHKNGFFAESRIIFASFG